MKRLLPSLPRQIERAGMAKSIQLSLFYARYMILRAMRANFGLVRFLHSGNPTNVNFLIDLEVIGIKFGAVTTPC